MKVSEILSNAHHDLVGIITVLNGYAQLTSDPNFKEILISCRDRVRLTQENFLNAINFTKNNKFNNSHRGFKNWCKRNIGAYLALSINMFVSALIGGAVAGLILFWVILKWGCI